MCTFKQESLHKLNQILQYLHLQNDWKYHSAHIDDKMSVLQKDHPCIIKEYHSYDLAQGSSMQEYNRW